mmetsp:Transcript_62165/g.110812  ORF Transcript_62165/g.110812 Transcript_62165/m.110812 type:complete len:239 (+) Transcript_62165:324-1040(+)
MYGELMGAASPISLLTARRGDRTPDCASLASAAPKVSVWGGAAWPSCMMLRMPMFTNLSTLMPVIFLHSSRFSSFRFSQSLTRVVRVSSVRLLHPLSDRETRLGHLLPSLTMPASVRKKQYDRSSQMRVGGRLSMSASLMPLAPWKLRFCKRRHWFVMRLMLVNRHCVRANSSNDWPQPSASTDSSRWLRLTPAMCSLRSCGHSIFTRENEVIGVGISVSTGQTRTDVPYQSTCSFVT